MFALGTTFCDMFGGWSIVVLPAVGAGTVDGVRAAEITQFQGRWVALDRRSDVVVADAPDLQALYRVIEQQHLADIVIQRVPARDEPLFIGLA